MEYMTKIATLLDSIANACDNIGSIAAQGSDQYPEFSDFFDEVSSIASEMIEQVIEAESITSMDLSDYD